MASAERTTDNEWRLDDESSERREHQPPLAPTPAENAAKLSHERLTRPIYVVTAEHFAWYLVVAYALITRAVALGARPLDPAQATDALTALLIAQHGRLAFALSDASWVTIVQGWIFAAMGATDAASRIVVTLCGLLLIATGFALRPVLGRAGALAFAALIAISPSTTYFSRGGSTVIASLTLMMIAITIAESMRRRPTVLRAAGLGVAIALWLTADPIGYVTGAVMIASLILVGAADAVRLDHRRLRLRVWWDRRRALSHRMRDRSDRLVVHPDDGFFSPASLGVRRIQSAWRIRPAIDRLSSRNSQIDSDFGFLRIHRRGSGNRRSHRDRLATYRRSFCGLVGGVGDRERRDDCGGERESN